MMKLVLYSALLALASVSLCAQSESPRSYQVWDDAPAPNRGADYSKSKARGYPIDLDWESHSYPIGNGYMGANVFGRTDRERIQITDKTLTSGLPYGSGGATNFAELTLNFGHHDISDYHRSLSLNDGIIYVDYEHRGVQYKREYLTSYPDNVLAIKLSASKAGKVSFDLQLEVPYLRHLPGHLAKIKMKRPIISQPERSKQVQYQHNDSGITMSGSVPSFSQNFEAQLKVINQGGQVIANASNGQNRLSVVDADSVTILLTLGTNYQLSSELFLTDDNQSKLNPKHLPHDKVSALMTAANKHGFEALKQRHIQDHQSLFSRVELALTDAQTELTTKALLAGYKQAPHKHRYLEELVFHYGRYLLIASSRKGTLPANLQGVWSQYHSSPWSAGYWHNINVQMNYWGAFNTNLAETFSAYDDFYQAYLAKAQVHADAYIKQHYPKQYQANNNGWAIGIGSNAYSISPLKSVSSSGPGMVGFTTKLFWDKFAFTQDMDYLKNQVYPALYGASQLLSKTLIEQDGALLVKHSASPEQKINGKVYVTQGTTFDQGFVWETYSDLLKAADILGIHDPFLDKIEEQMARLDPILIGKSGQLKEYREEQYYGELGDPKHRHISHLCTVYPGTLVTSQTPKWQKAANTALELRGVEDTTGWAMAHRMNVHARTKTAQQAHNAYQQMLKQRVVENLWATHPPFQIDANLGVMAGVAEMLLQSHEGYIEPLAALPGAWPNGRYGGLVARGNFEVSVDWSNGDLTQLSLLSNRGKQVRLKLPNASEYKVTDGQGKRVQYRTISDDLIEFDTKTRHRYQILK